MGYYNVVKPCVVGKLHYTRPTTAPIEVDDDVAAPLVESGDLTPYDVFNGAVDLEGSVLGDVVAESMDPTYVAPELGVGFVEPFAVQDEKPESRPRGRRKATED